jgi:chromosomal replication initiator protein
VPNKFTSDWILEHYADILSEIIKDLSASNLRVEMVYPEEVPAIDSSVYPAKEKPKKDAVSELIDGLGLSPKYTFEGFVVGPSNKIAHAAAYAVAASPAQSPYNPLFIYGKVGLGKTHLMQAAAHHIAKNHPKAKVLYISSERFTNQLIQAIQNRSTTKFRQLYRSVDVLFIDDIHFIAGKESTQEEFFHTFNALYEAHKQIVISSDRSPKEIPSLEDRLVSRFVQGFTVDIKEPELETRVAILQKKQEKEPVKVSREVLYYIAEKITTNIRELEGALIRVIAYATLTSQPIAIELAKEVLKDLIKEERNITTDLIQRKVAEYYDLSVADLKSRKRAKGIAKPRLIAMYLARMLTQHSFPEIGEFFGGKDHTTALHAYNKIKNDLEKDLQLKKVVDNLVHNIRKMV